MISKRWPKLLILALGIILVYTSFTDADFIVRHYIRDNLFKATTLDFSNRQTANEFPTSTLFNISGMVASGFAVESVRIKKEGETSFLYQITPEIVTASHLCELLRLRVLNEDWQQIYQGELISFKLNASVTNDFDDLIFVVYLGEDPGQNHRCDFNIVIETTNESNETETGFWDKEILQNSIST